MHKRRANKAPRESVATSSYHRQRSSKRAMDAVINRLWNAYSLPSGQTEGRAKEPDPTKVQQKLSDDWVAPYLGDTCSAFLNTIKEHIEAIPDGAREGSYYAQVINVLQSSGMGKSKLLAEVAKQVFSITFTLRKPEGRGFPKGDPEIYDFCTKSGLSHPIAISLLAATLQKSKYFLTDIAFLTY
jgi:hypothetical protein